MKALLLAICFMIFSLNCLAISSPNDIIQDTIRQEKDSFVNEARFQFHKSFDDILENFKNGLKILLTWIAETGTVIAIGWCLTFLVDKRTAKMIKLITIICFATELIKLLSRFINFVHS